MLAIDSISRAVQGASHTAGLSASVLQMFSAYMVIMYGFLAHHALRLVLSHVQAGSEAATEHEELPGGQLLHLHLLPPLLVIMQHLPVGDFL